MKDIVALCKRRGFIFAASDIYGGINGFWDYGPLGVELKNNLRDLWWKHMVTTPPVGPDGQPVQIVGLDSAIIQNPKAWEASGHVGGFSDPMVDCKETKLRYRADHLKIIRVDSPDKNLFFAFIEETSEEEMAAKVKKVLGKSVQIGAHESFLECVDKLHLIVAPDAKESGTLTPPKQFNLMFHTYVGATASEENKAYLRPETAQGIFLNFKNVMDSSRVKLPFGIAQIGKAFRNEVTPRNFIFRSREFEQMEMEWFCHPDEVETWMNFWFEERQKFWKNLGLSSDNLQMRQHGQDELSHYAKEGLGTSDIEYRFPFTAPDFGELEGIAHRCDFDLTAHSEHSGQKLEYTDPNDQKNRFIPHVIEPAAGLTRGVLALICEAYTPDPNRPSGVYLNFHPSVAPKKAAILPLTAKDSHVPLATKIYMDLREHYAVDLDIKQNIGKRYARQDEIGTPFCFTIDDQSNEDSTVTVRHRNTMKQERIAIESIRTYMEKEMALMAQ
ncbi:MAG: glycine--tRNA ligase [Alphaproteobacteria bacterium CG_4_9_14_3_um_filter_47_13]|nr:MAG: glycine--tRNA ligase [Alphaproteobacteria bacterium CG_4_9_14_3_um_filter_47_13]